jgi:hypothetical protein
MLCPVCGEVLARAVVQSEARWLAHHLLKHQPPTIQALGALALTFCGVWLVSKLDGGRGWCFK